MKKFLSKTSKGFTTFSLHKRGFTLVELLVVVSIIAILAVIGLAVFSGVQKNARDSKRKADIDAIGKAWEAHYQNTTPRYPTLLESWFAGGNIPADPINTGTSVYSGTGSNSNTYCVCALLEGGGGNSPGPGCGAAPGNYYCRTNQQ